MEYIIENEQIKVTITTWGAQVMSVLRKCDGVEHMWNADPSVWRFHAPILFPYTGKVKDGMMEMKGQIFENLPPHGFARNVEHTLIFQNAHELKLELCDSELTHAVWPYAFRLVSAFKLDGDTLHHSLTVENRDDAQMPFGVGFHPGFAIPFDHEHTVTDYELRFDTPQSPLCLNMSPNGLYEGKTSYLDYNNDTITIDEHLFDNGSACMTGLTAKTLGLYEKGSGRAVVCKIENYPYVLIWSQPGIPKFICIEPWHSLPSSEDSDRNWERKPAATVLTPGQSWSTVLSTSFVR